MNNPLRAYDKNSPADQRWTSMVREAAKPVIVRLLGAGGPITTKAIYTAMKQAHPQLCDDSIRVFGAPNKPKWEHPVDNTLQIPKKQGKVSWNTGERSWGVGGTHPVPARQQRGTAGVAVPVPSAQQPVALPSQVPPSPPIPGPTDLRKSLRDRLLMASPKEFEKVVGELLKAMGLEQVRVLGQTADSGIDGDAVLPILNVKVGFQAKRWSGNNVSGALVREPVGSVTTKKYDRGVFVTTSAFTAGAKEEAEAADSKVILVDGEKLLDMMIERRLGIRTVTAVTRQEVDEGFFKLS